MNSKIMLNNENITGVKNRRKGFKAKTQNTPHKIKYSKEALLSYRPDEEQENPFGTSFVKTCATDFQAGCSIAKLASDDKRLIMPGGFLFPCLEGVTYRGIRYTTHALERMAPDTSEIIELLYDRACSRMDTKVLEVKAMQIGRTPRRFCWWKNVLIRTGNILPSEVEAAIMNPGRTNLAVIRGANGDIVTVYRNNNVRTENLSAEFWEANAKLHRRALRLENSFKLFHRGASTALDSKRTTQKDFLIARRARIVRDKVLLLVEPLKKWELKYQALKRERQKKSVDIAAWKASRKGKQAAPDTDDEDELSDEDEGGSDLLNDIFDNWNHFEI